MREREVIIVFSDLVDWHEGMEDVFSHLPVFDHITFTEFWGIVKSRAWLEKQRKSPVIFWFFQRITPEGKAQKSTQTNLTLNILENKGKLKLTN